MSGNDGTEVRPEGPDAVRRRRRRRMVYGGIGGGLTLGAAAIYFFFFLGVVLTLDQAIDELREQHPDAAMTLDPRSQHVNTMSNLEATTGREAAETPAASGRVAVGFVEEPTVAKALGVPERARLVVASTHADPQRAGYSVVRLQQFVEGVRLFGADIAVSLRNGPSAAINSVVVQSAEAPDLDLTPAVDAAGAQRTALGHYESLAVEPRRLLPRVNASGAPELVVFDPERLGVKGVAALAWRLRVGPLEMFVDAKANRVNAVYDTRHSVRLRLTHDCTPGLDCKLVLNEGGAVAAPPPPGPDATRVHSDMATVHQYFLDHFQRNGFDDALGAGGSEAIRSFVRIGNFDNAQWSPDERRFDFGVGWATLDIAGHEYAHAVTTFGPRLTYAGQPGAVNEFFSDFFAAMIERETTGATDWRIGEGVAGFSAARPLRDMANPHKGMFDPKRSYDPATNGGQPAHFNELVTADHLICSSIIWPINDNDCVHFNSGILNKAMTLAIDGGSASGVTVTPIAREKLEQIMFRTLMLGVTSASGLKATASGAVIACQQLIGSSHQIVQADCTALGRAFAAVGLS